MMILTLLKLWVPVTMIARLKEVKIQIIQVSDAVTVNNTTLNKRRFIVGAPSAILAQH